MTTLKCLSDNSDISDISDLRSTIYFPSVWDLPGSCMMSDFEWNLNIFVLCCEVKIIQLCPTLCDLIDSTVHGILQARVLECGAFSFSRASSQPRDWTQVSHIAGGSFTNWAIREVRYAMRLNLNLLFKLWHCSGRGIVCMCCMVTARKVEGQIPHSIVRGSSFYFWREGTRPLAPPMWPSNDTCYNWELVKVLTVHLASSDLSQQGGREG